MSSLNPFKFIAQSNNLCGFKVGVDARMGIRFHGHAALVNGTRLDLQGLCFDIALNVRCLFELQLACVDVALNSPQYKQVCAADIALHTAFFANDDAAIDVQFALNMAFNFNGIFS